MTVMIIIRITANMVLLFLNWIEVFYVTLCSYTTHCHLFPWASVLLYNTAVEQWCNNNNLSKYSLQSRLLANHLPKCGYDLWEKLHYNYYIVAPSSGVYSLKNWFSALFCWSWPVTLLDEPIIDMIIIPRYVKIYTQHFKISKAMSMISHVLH